MDKKSKTVTFYILWPGNTEEDCYRDMNKIGVECYYKSGNPSTMKTSFIKMDGYRILEQMITKEKVDVLENVSIFNCNGKKFSIEQLFDRINKSSIVK